MSTLLIRLAGPMQSWGTQDRFEVRATESEPSKSGVVGLLAAALGRPRDVPVDDLAALRMGVRVDLEGAVRLDYHTAGAGDGTGIRKADGKTGGVVVSRRYYLADADFLVGLEGDDTLLEQLEEALQAPVWPLALGRKAFPPGVPPYLPGGGLRVGLALEEALKSEPWPRKGLDAGNPPVTGQLRAVIECAPGPGTLRRNDQPIGAAFAVRSFVPRAVRIESWALGEAVPRRSEVVDVLVANHA